MTLPTDTTRMYSSLDNVEFFSGASSRMEVPDAHTVIAASDTWGTSHEVAPGETTTNTFENGGDGVYREFHGSAALTGTSRNVGVGDATIKDPLGGGGGGRC